MDSGPFWRDKGGNGFCSGDGGGRIRILALSAAAPPFRSSPGDARRAWQRAERADTAGMSLLNTRDEPNRAGIPPPIWVRRCIFDPGDAARNECRG
ncbi:hypothetical protein BDZ85DRAFT_261333 [Elsinoe ampelina]|uniref:Uncharacterized protein n=1 Tax=Elsinoe ampelina TaxID=302913 RepID=A0A6A6GC45_9PEZI|nr:hypothetical protein BDZ85DRAFT_261333 [Elsinoe ampelina]